ncbi:MAG: 3-hydroxyacyl-CoA dehydrogenase family protein, partial [Candidatus Nanohaloarchaea archaeon]|nr:3-hydroxyacyl-CoA dehydrogenase family protein [Candidatus Nanohaloarchaea archaeon]
EVVKTEETSKEVENEVLELVEETGKEHSLVKDSPGFVSNRILMPLINEAVKALEEGVSRTEDIDKIAEKGLNHPMGPLKLADFIGLDVCLDIMERIYEETGEERFRPAELLEEKVEEGKLGKKSGKGFYSYN